MYSILKNYGNKIYFLINYKPIQNYPHRNMWKRKFIYINKNMENKFDINY